MPFQLGHPRYGGRKVGTRSRHIVDRERLMSEAMAAAVEATGITPPTLDDIRRCR